jgi:hypothetical protein
MGRGQDLYRGFVLGGNWYCLLLMHILIWDSIFISNVYNVLFGFVLILIF